MFMDKLALILAVIGGINWGSVGIFGYDFIAMVGGGETTMVSRIAYTIIGLAAVWCVSLLFRRDAVEARA